MTSFKTKGRIFRKINWKFNFLQLTSSYIFQAVANAFPSVDTFFLLSGCLVAYLTLKELDKTKGRVNWIMVIVHRYLRYSYTPLPVMHTVLLPLTSIQQMFWVIFLDWPEFLLTSSSFTQPWCESFRGDQEIHFQLASTTAEHPGGNTFSISLTLTAILQ